MTYAETVMYASCGLSVALVCGEMAEDQLYLSLVYD